MGGWIPITGVFRSEKSLSEVVRGRHEDRRIVREIQHHRLWEWRKGPRNTSVFQKLKKARKIESPLEWLERNVANSFRPVRSLLDFYIASKRTNLCCFKSTKFSVLCHSGNRELIQWRAVTPSVKIISILTPLKSIVKSAPKLLPQLKSPFYFSKFPDLCSSRTHALMNSYP